VILRFIQKTGGLDTSSFLTVSLLGRDAVLVDDGILSAQRFIFKSLEVQSCAAVIIIRHYVRSMSHPIESESQKFQHLLMTARAKTSAPYGGGEAGLTKNLFEFGKSNIPQYHHECVPYGHASHGHTFYGHDLISVYLTGVYLIGVCLIGLYLTGRASDGRVSYECVPYEACILRAYISCRYTSWACTL
jgi:hypothetical protein